MTTAPGTASEGVGKYVVIYVCILGLAGLQFLQAYQTSHDGLFVRMLLVAGVEAVLAVLFFMHLWTERRALLFSLVIYGVFVLTMMNVIWSDSFRLLHLRPFMN